MKIYEFDTRDLFISEDIVEEFSVHNRKDAQGFFDERIDELFVTEPKFMDFIKLYGEINNLEKYAMLAADGGGEIFRWTYQDGSDELIVQDWIDIHDGRYSGLLLNVCNPNACTPRSGRSAILISDRIIGGSHEKHNPIYSLLVNNKEIDSYLIEYEIEELKKQSKKEE